MQAPCLHLLSLYRRSNSKIFIFRDAPRAGELLVPKSGPKSALNPESAVLNIIYSKVLLVSTPLKVLKDKKLVNTKHKRT